MAFPTSPTNNQQTTVNGITYQYNSTTNSWKRILNNITSSTNLSGGVLGQIPYQTAAGTTEFFGPGTSGQILVSGGAAIPVYTNTSSIEVGKATNISAGVANQIPYQTGAGATSFITAPSTSNTFLKWGGSSYSWAGAGKCILSGYALTIKRANATYFGFAHNLAANATESTVQMPVPFAGTARNLYIRLSANASTTVGVGYTFTVRKNATSSNLAATVFGATTTGNDLVDTYTFAAGDQFSIVATPTTTQPVDNLNVWWTMEYEPS